MNKRIIKIIIWLFEKYAFDYWTDIQVEKQKKEFQDAVIPGFFDPMELSKLIKKQDEEFEKKWKRIERTMTGHISGRKIWSVSDDVDDSYAFIDETLKTFIAEVRREIVEFERERILKILPKEKIAQPEENWDGKSGTFGAFNDCLKQVKQILKQ